MISKYNMIREEIRETEREFVEQFKAVGRKINHANEEMEAK